MLLGRSMDNPFDYQCVHLHKRNIIGVVSWVEKHLSCEIVESVLVMDFLSARRISILLETAPKRSTHVDLTFEFIIKTLTHDRRLCRYDVWFLKLVVNLDPTHFHALAKIFEVLKGSHSYKLCYVDNIIVLQGYIDINWISDNNHTSRRVIMYSYWMTLLLLGNALSRFSIAEC